MQEELIRRFRELEEPIILFGEEYKDRYLRLRKLEMVGFVVLVFELPTSPDHSCIGTIGEGKSNARSSK